MSQVDINQIKELLPHRYPFLLIDRVVDYTMDESLTAIKNITVNEPFFQGHFPHQPIMPGVLILEAMAQACGVLCSLSLGKSFGGGGVYYFVGIDNARFKKPATPGDQLVIKASVARKIRGIWKFDATAYIDDEVCCQASLMCTYKE